MKHLTRIEFILAQTLLLLSIAAEPVKITTDGIFKRDPVYILDATEIAYSVQVESRLMILVRCKLTDKTISRMHPKSRWPETRPIFSSDSQHFSYMRSDGNQILNVYYGQLDDAEGKNVGEGRNAAIAPDASRIYFSKFKGASQQIVSVTLDGKGMEEHTKFTEPAVWSNYPHISPDGSKMVFMTTRDNGDQEIYSMVLSTGKTKRLTEHAGRDFRPTWSPDGKQIAFASQRNGNLDIYVMNEDGSNVRRVTHSEGLDDYPSWHPNGKSLIHACEHNGRYDIFSTTLE